MAVCTRKRFKREQLCTGDLDKYGGIFERVQEDAGYDDDDTDIDFQLVKNVFFGVETLAGVNSGSARFNNINILSNATHLFYIYVDPELPLLDRGNHFIQFNNRYFRILAATNKDEDDFYIFLQATERGPTSQAANEA